jgi:hypothetical protein
MGDAEEMARFEAKAEEAYTAMYDAAPHNVKDCYDDASLYLNRAILLAGKLGRQDEAARLKNRSEHIAAVYNHQFRYAGR